MRNKNILIFLLFCFLFTWRPVLALDDPSGKITAAIKKYIFSVFPEWADQKIKVNFVLPGKLQTEMNKYSNQASLSVINVYQSFRPVGNVIFPLLIQEGAESHKFFLRTKVEVMAPIVVAAQSIKRGEIIMAAALTTEVRDISTLPKDFYREEKLLLHNEASTMIPENSTIFRWMIREIPLVRRGETIMILIKGDNLSVKADGVALMDGYLGQPIKIKRKQTGNNGSILQGTLVSSHEVEIDFK